MHSLNPEKIKKKVKPGIRISFHSGKDTYVLMIKDNGIGIPYGFNLLQTDSLGMKIVNTLTGQLGGSLSVRNDNGTEITVRFPVYPEK